MKKEIKIAIVVTVILATFVWGFNFLKGKNLLSSYNYYYVSFSEIGGLQTSNPVTLNGYNVGLVSNISFADESLRGLIVEIGIKKEYQIPEDSKVQLTSDILGGKSLSLKLGKSETMLQPNSTVKGTAAPDLLDELLNSPTVANLNTALQSLDSVLVAINAVLDLETQKDLQQIVKNIDNLVVSQRAQIAKILSNLSGFTSSLSESNEDIQSTFANLRAISDTLSTLDINQTVAAANKSFDDLQQLIADLRTGDGTVAKLAQDSTAYHNLQSSLSSLNLLLEDIRENPKRYVNISVFGGRDKSKSDKK